MAEYSSLLEEARLYQDRNCCTVIALAVVTDNNFATAARVMQGQGRRRNCGARAHQYLAALTVLGHHAYDVTSRIQAKTVRSIGPELAQRFPGIRFMIRVRGHLLAFDGWKIQDWSANRMKRIIQVWAISVRDDCDPTRNENQWNQQPVQQPVPVQQPAAPVIRAITRQAGSLAALCLELGMDPAKARKALRKAGLRAPYVDLNRCREVLTSRK